MSAGNQLIRSIVDAGAAPVFRELQAHYFLQEELPLFQRVQQHYLRHGQLPSVETLFAQGINLPTVHEPVSYYLQEVRRRYAYNNINRHYRSLVPAMQSRQPEQAVQIMEQCVRESRSVLQPATYSTLAQLMDTTETRYTQARANLGRLRGITLGYPTLDDITLGAQGGDIIVVAGRPGMGKSYVLLQMANAAYNAGYSTSFVSMEMSLEQIGQRWLAIETGINPRFIRSGELAWWTEQTLRATIQRVREEHAAVPAHFLSGDFSKSVEGVEQMVEQFTPSILFVDAAYLLTSEGQSKGYISKWESISNVIGALKRLALRKNIPIVITVQLNRNVKSGQQREVDLGDVAGSDSIPQDASVLIALREGASPYERIQRFLQVLKNRDGMARDFSIDFTFSPASFREIVNAPGALDTSWML